MMNEFTSKDLIQCVNRDIIRLVEFQSTIKFRAKSRRLFGNYRF
jgi:hypothetical protein